ncbi:MAG: hypothetical protein SPF18_03935 [Blautia sp.]|nr:hypothetical protein [Blautia sp.]
MKGTNGMIDFIMKYWLEVGFGILTGCVAGGFKWISAKLKARKEEDDAIKEGVLALLHDRLYQGCKYYIHQGEISDDEMKNMEYLYNGYHALGGNGTGTELYNRIKKLPLKEE